MDIITKNTDKTCYKNGVSIQDLERKITNIIEQVYCDYDSNPSNAFLNDKIFVDTFESIFMIEQAKLSVRPDKKLLLNQMLFITDLLIRQLSRVYCYVYVDQIENLANKIKKALTFFIQIEMSSILIEITSCMIFLDLIKSGSKCGDYTLNVYRFYEHIKDCRAKGRNFNRNELAEINNEFANSLNLRLDNEKSYWDFYNKLFHEKLDLHKYDSGWIKAPQIKNSNPPTVRMKYNYSLRYQNKSILNDEAAPEYKRFIKLLNQFGINFGEDKRRRVWTFFLDDMKILKSFRNSFPDSADMKFTIIDTNSFLQKKNPLYEMLFQDY